MIIRTSDTRTFPIADCHGGTGALMCREILGDYERREPGFTMVHEDVLAPGVSIGEHEHRGDEEIYVILEGSGTMLVNGTAERVTAGDMCITRDGESHSILNDGEGDLRLLVVCVRTSGNSGSDTPAPLGGPGLSN